jgi:hypothetical protein
MMCVSGASRAGAEVLARMPTARLAAFYVWVPVLPGDSMDVAGTRSLVWAEPRAQHYWDAGREFAQHLGEALEITAAESQGAGAGPGIAWDVYLLYAPGDRRIEKPDFWMHQLYIERAPRLKDVEWQRWVEQAVRQGHP